jgi:hypothetical protein
MTSKKGSLTDQELDAIVRETMNMLETMQERQKPKARVEDTVKGVLTLVVALWVLYALLDLFSKASWELFHPWP